MQLHGGGGGWGCADRIRESALKVDCEKKFLAALENQTCVIGIPVRHYQLSIIPILKLNTYHSEVIIVEHVLQLGNPMCVPLS